MKGFIEVHGRAKGEPIMIGVSHITSITVATASPAAINFPEVKAVRIEYIGNAADLRAKAKQIFVRESYIQVRDLLEKAGKTTR